MSYGSPAPPWRIDVSPCYNRRFMPKFIPAILAAARVFFRSRSDLAVEILALRQQVAAMG